MCNLETELHDLLLRYERPAYAWPRGRNAIERARIGREVEDARTRIGEVMARNGTVGITRTSWRPSASSYCRY